LPRDITTQSLKKLIHEDKRDSFFLNTQKEQLLSQYQNSLKSLPAELQASISAFDLSEELILGQSDSQSLTSQEKRIIQSLKDLQTSKLGLLTSKLKRKRMTNVASESDENSHISMEKGLSISSLSGLELPFLPGLQDILETTPQDLTSAATLLSDSDHLFSD
jgi:hypothetical protein